MAGNCKDFPKLVSSRGSAGTGSGSGGHRGDTACSVWAAHHHLHPQNQQSARVSGLFTACIVHPGCKKRGMWVKKSGNVELRSLSPKRCPVVGACLPQRPCSPGRWAAVLFHGGDAKEQLVYYFYQIFNTVPEAPASNSQLLLSRKKSTESKPPSCSERPLTLFHTAQPNEKRECPPGPAALP